MSDTNQFETLQLQHIFQNASMPNIGDATGLPASATAGSLYLSLLSADPGESGTSQATNELSYTGYARIAIARTSGAWTVSGNTASNAALATFAACTAGSGTAAYWGLGTAASGAGYLLLTGQVTTPSGGLSISAGVTPEFAIGALTYTKD